MFLSFVFSFVLPAQLVFLNPFLYFSFTKLKKKSFRNGLVDLKRLQKFCQHCLFGSILAVRWVKKTRFQFKLVTGTLKSSQPVRSDGGTYKLPLVSYLWCLNRCCHQTYANVPERKLKSAFFLLEVICANPFRWITKIFIVKRAVALEQEMAAVNCFLALKANFEFLKSRY